MLKKLPSEKIQEFDNNLTKLTHKPVELNNDGLAILNEIASLPAEFSTPLKQGFFNLLQNGTATIFVMGQVFTISSIDDVYRLIKLIKAHMASIGAAAKAAAENKEDGNDDLGNKQVDHIQLQILVARKILLKRKSEQLQKAYNVEKAKFMLFQREIDKTRAEIGALKNMQGQPNLSIGQKLQIAKQIVDCKKTLAHLGKGISVMFAKMNVTNENIAENTKQELALDVQIFGKPGKETGKDVQKNSKELSVFEIALLKKQNSAGRAA